MVKSIPALRAIKPFKPLTTFLFKKDHKATKDISELKTKYQCPLIPTP